MFDTLGMNLGWLIEMVSVEKDLRERLAKVAQQIWDDGLTYGTAGNISAKIPETTNILIKPSGMRFCDLTPEDFLIVDIYTRELISGERKPSVETPFHTLMYKSRDYVGGVVHTHSHYAVVLGTAGVELVPMGMGLYSAPCLIKGVGVAKYAPPGTDQLADSVDEGLGERCAVLMPHHGMMAVGKTIEEAYHIAKAVEDLAKFQFEVMQVGRVPPVPESMKKSFLEIMKKQKTVV